jgi:excisionase family DNA binding protein
MQSTIEKISPREQKEASKVLKTLSKVQLKNSKITIQIQNTQETITISKKIFDILNLIVDLTAKGKPITILQQDEELTTQQLADFLNVSRPYVVKLIDKNIIPSKKVGKHRRVLLEDAKKYKEEMQKKRAKNLGDLVKQAQELNLGY